MGVRRIRMTVAYDGTPFAGFQRQPDRRTVQGDLEQALARVTGEKIVICGAGRTDAGVHSLGQVTHFDTGWGGPVEKLPIILYPRLSPEIAVISAGPAPNDFHARYSARFRRYGYQFLCSSRPDPLRERFALRVSPGLDLEAMEEAASCLRGQHDFSVFVSEMKIDEQLDPVRCIHHVRWMRRGHMVILLVQADGFLRHMVRNIVGNLMVVGSGGATVSAFESLMCSRERITAARPAPAKGLCLLRVGY